MSVPLVTIVKKSRLGRIIFDVENVQKIPKLAGSWVVNRTVPRAAENQRSKDSWVETHPFLSTSGEGLRTPGNDIRTFNLWRRMPAGQPSSTLSSKGMVLDRQLVAKQQKTEGGSWWYWQLYLNIIQLCLNIIQLCFNIIKLCLNINPTLFQYYPSR